MASLFFDVEEKCGEDRIQRSFPFESVTLVTCLNASGKWTSDHSKMQVTACLAGINEPITFSADVAWHFMQEWKEYQSAYCQDRQARYATTQPKRFPNL